MADHLDIAAVILAVEGRLDASVEGKPVLRQVYDTVVGWGAAEPVVIVFSKQTEPLLSSMDLAESVVVIDEDGSGTGSALSVGLDALTHLHPDASAAFVVDGDVPGVPVGLAEALMTELESSGRMAAVPQYRYVRSGPVLVGRQLWDRFMASETDQALAEMLIAHPNWTSTVVVSADAPVAVT